MKSTSLLIAGALTFAVGTAWAVHLERSSKSCPRPSAASVTMLFDPCQAYKEANATDKPGTAPAKAPPTPDQIVSQDFQSLENNHATVGTAPAKR